MLGLGVTKQFIFHPTGNPYLNNITEIVSGNKHTLFLDARGNVYSVGNKKYEQLGLCHNKNVIIPTKLKI